jgi:phenylacetate-coenzyme A ligase PaaK-like adenylate-forming protein
VSRIIISKRVIQRNVTYKLTLNTVMNLYTDEISKLAILAKLPVPKKATLNKITCKTERYH